MHFDWANAIAPEHWECYRRVILGLRAAGLPFLLGGGFALAAYTGRWRNTKDIDFYILRKDRKAAIETLSKAQFEDYFPTLPYDRKWIYRSTCSGVIADIIWAMANQRAQVDEHWFEFASPGRVRGEPLQVVPLEEFIWCKLYILQRDHCDWTDVFNLLYVRAEHVNWRRLLDRVSEDWPLLKAMLTAFGWLCPKRYLNLPAFLRDHLKLDQSIARTPRRRNRVRLIDSRSWFVAALAKGKPLEV